MFKFIVLAAFVTLATAQNYNRDPKTAAIISEQRYLNGDGKFGAAYTQEDGTDFKEETDEQGNRRGSYSYVDPNGQKRTISYTAGKNGFQATGDHLPVGPAPPPQPAQPAYQPQQNYQQQQYQQPQYQQPQYSNNGGAIEEGQYDERWNDPEFSQQQKKYNNYQAPAPVRNYNPQPAPPPAPAPVHYNQPQQNYQQQQYQQPQYQPQQYTTTPNPHRFLPPGKLNLNRTPDGFSYSFNKA